MSSDPDPNGKEDHPGGSGENASGGPASEDERESDALAARLAYESGWRRCEDALRTLAQNRTITAAVLSLTLPAAGVVASLSAIGDPNNNTGCIAVAGWTVLALAALCALLAAGRVLRPITTIASLGAMKIVENYITPAAPGRNPNWVYTNLARDLDNAYDDMDKELAVRSFAYNAVLISAFFAFIGAAIVVLDAAL